MIPMFSIRLCSSGLSYVESKELTKAEPNQRSARPRTPPDQTRPVTKARADTRDRSLMDAAANDVNSAKTLQEPLKGHPGQKESISEPMRTRRSHNAEVRKLSSSAEAGSTPAGKTPEVEKRTENISPIVPPEKEHEKETQPEVPQSPVKESPPPKAGPDQREDQLDAAVDSKDMVMEASGVLDTQKRKSPCETDREETPEKRPRLSSVSSVSSVSSASPSASSMSSPATPSSTSRRVSPLKVRKPNPQVLWLLTVSKFSERFEALGEFGVGKFS